MIGKLPYTMNSSSYGDVNNYHLNKLMERSIKNILLFKNFKTFKIIPKQSTRPKYLLSSIQFNKKQYFLRNRRISKSRTRLFYTAGTLRLEPVVLNRVSFLHKRFVGGKQYLNKAALKKNTLYFLKKKILLNSKLALLKAHQVSY